MNALDKKLWQRIECETHLKNRARFKKMIVFCAFFFLFGSCLFAGNNVTRYYKQIKVVTKDHKEQAGNGGGQFITFNNNGCYDSDKSGYEVGNGFLKFGKKTAERVYYSGSSYWGNAMYIFTENYGRLNIVVESSGITYVYILATAPANVYTCALIKDAKPKTNPTYVNPINPVIVNPVTPIGGDNNIRTSTRRTCPGCNGTGNGHEEIIYTPDYTGNSSCYCSKCGRTGSCHTHRTTLCRVCYGKRYVE